MQKHGDSRTNLVPRLLMFLRALFDNPYLDRSSNGLSYVVERMKGQALSGHVTLAKSERSTLASLASEML